MLWSEPFHLLKNRLSGEAPREQLGINQSVLSCQEELGLSGDQEQFVPKLFVAGAPSSLFSISLGDFPSTEQNTLDSRCHFIVELVLPYVPESLRTIVTMLRKKGIKTSPNEVNT